MGIIMRRTYDNVNWYEDNVTTFTELEQQCSYFLPNFATISNLQYIDTNDMSRGIILSNVNLIASGFEIILENIVEKYK